MNKRFRIAIAAATMVGGFTITQAGSASAAHCFEGNTPGFSYFGTDHVKEARHTNEGSTRPHAGSPGASNCRNGAPSSTDPSTRAPGQQP